MSATNAKNNRKKKKNSDRESSGASSNNGNNKGGRTNKMELSTFGSGTNKSAGINKIASQMSNGAATTTNTSSPSRSSSSESSLSLDEAVLLEQKKHELKAAQEQQIQLDGELKPETELSNGIYIRN